MVLGSIYWLCWLTHLPGGILASRFGAKLTFGLPNLLASALFFVLPMAAYYYLTALIAVRVIQGLLVGLTFPCLHTITARWVPPNERGSFITAYLGGTIAVAVGYPLFGWVMAARRWDDIFYISGCFGVVWAVAWFWLMYDSPSQHPRISSEEREYLGKALAGVVADRKLSTPWRKLLTSGQVWLNILANFAFMWIFLLAQVYFPMYFRVVFHMEFSQTALIAGLPHVVRLVTSLLSSLLCDYLLKKRKISRNVVRKVSTAICTLLAGIFLLSLSYTGCNENLAIFFVLLIVACTGLPNSGFYATIIDIAPNFCAIIYGLSMIAGTLAGIVLTSYVGWMTEVGHSIGHWQKIFQVVASIGIVTGLVYLIFARSEVLEWNNPTVKQPGTEMKDLATNNNEPAQDSEREPLKEGE